MNSFESNPHPFISKPFIELNQNKADRIIHLVEDVKKRGMGLVAGVRDGMVLSPFSAPFGGFHFRHESIYMGEIDRFLSLLKDYIVSEGLRGIEMVLPPDLYHVTFNAKTVNSFIRSGFQSHLPDLTSWIDLDQFQGSFNHQDSRKHYNQAVRAGLVFKHVTELDEKREAYDLVSQNRARYGRPIFMTFDDVLNTSKLWTTDFFKVTSVDHSIVASGITYQSHPGIAYGLFWGDSEAGRPFRAMDFLAFNLWTYYKDLGFKYIDSGTCTESGIPNEGLLRFKETHNATSSLKHRFYWYNQEAQD
jgi:hypothetical protein